MKVLFERTPGNTHRCGVQVAKTLGRSLETNKLLPMGADVDPECLAYVPWLKASVVLAKSVFARLKHFLNDRMPKHSIQ